MLQTNWKFIKYVIHNKPSMTPKQLKKKAIKQIIKIKPHEKLDIDEGESIEMKRSVPHLQNCQKKILHLTHLLKLEKSQK